MPSLTQLRLPGEEEYAWYALDRVVDRPLGCSNCNRRIDPETPHARGDGDGRRLCPACVEVCWRGETIPSEEANRRQRERRHQHALEQGAQTLLDGLEVGSIRELKRLVDAARAFESGRDFLTGRRYAEMHPLSDSPILVVYVAAEDVPLSERHEQLAAEFARLAVLRINRDREASRGA